MKSEMPRREKSLNYNKKNKKFSNRNKSVVRLLQVFIEVVHIFDAFVKWLIDFNNRQKCKVLFFFVLKSKRPQRNLYVEALFGMKDNRNKRITMDNYLFWLECHSPRNRLDHFGSNRITDLLPWYLFNGIITCLQCWVCRWFFFLFGRAFTR